MTSCQRCHSLDALLETLTATIRRLLTEQNTAGPERPTAAAERACGHGYARLGGQLTRCVLPVGHDTAHDNGRGVMWARAT